MDPAFYEFYSLGLGDPISVSAVHGHGTGDLLDECVANFPPESEYEADDDRIRVAVIGKPNVGKSSLVNLILGEKRVIVSNMAGTTRDAVDTYFENKYGRYVFIDTAGIRRRSKVDDRIEKFSVMRAKLAIDRADVCLIMIDAREGVTEQDTKIAGLAHEAGKASVIVVNKWDLVEKDGKTMDKLRKDVLRDLSFMSYAPRALHLGPHRPEDGADIRARQLRQRPERHEDNDRHAQRRARRRPGAPAAADRQGQEAQDILHDTDRRPAAELRRLLQQPELFHFSYQRYIENQIRAAFGLEGTPIRIVIRQKGDKE